MSDECLSLSCPGVVLSKRQPGVPGDVNLATCDVCGLRYRRTSGGWAVVGPVVVTLGEGEPVFCAGVSFEPEGVVFLIEGGADRLVPAKDLLRITPWP